jgi:[protein-PII] uridylyltransferase
MVTESSGSFDAVSDSREDGSVEPPTTTGAPADTTPARLDRDGFFAAATKSRLGGRRFIAAWTAHVDRWLAALFTTAVEGIGRDAKGIALVAVGGYGRDELCPYSDLDVLLLHSGRSDISAIAERLWYPVWDEGVKLGHAVRTPREALGLANDDLDTATALLDVRHLAGDEALSATLAEGASTGWEKNGRRWLGRLADSVEQRHARALEVAFHLEPDLKVGRGGLRDVHALRWAGRARQVLLDDDHATLDEGYEFLLAMRVALHLQVGRPTDILALQEQDGVAAALDLDADTLMAHTAAIGRAIAWRSDETWYRVRSLLAGPGWAFSRKDRDLGGGLVERDREVHLLDDADPTLHPELALRAAAAAAARDTRVDRASLRRLSAETPTFVGPWPPGTREALVELLLAGPAALPQIEALDQLGIWGRILPEWAPVRSRPQRNAYHRFTVDRHLCEAAANAAGLVDRVDRPDLLVLGALFHDLGKGRGGDHTEVGMVLVEELGERMGLPPEDVASLVAMVEHHLLLPDVATRRDVGDPETIDAVAAAVGSLQTLELLDALTEADSLATGPAAWGPWKAGLVAELVDRTAERLGGKARHEHRPRTFPTAEQLALLEAGVPAISGSGAALTVVAPDRPGLFSRVAGVVSLHGLAVRSADALSGEHGLALEHIEVAPPRDEPIDWDRVVRDLERALDGRLALRARLADRVRTYSRSARHTRDAAPTVTIDNDATVRATVVEVYAPDAIGLLYRVTGALAELDVDIRSAKVQTLGDTVVDAFYVRNAAGEKITDAGHLAEIERALLHAVGTL